MPLTPAARLERIVVVANTASGSVGPQAPETARKILDSFGVEAEIFTPSDGSGIGVCLDQAFAASPDLVIVLAGDGAARAAAERAGPKGPLIAPLPGGTMNMLPHAVYGAVDWEQALRDALERGKPTTIGGGAIDGKLFFVAAILGAPALWAQVCERGAPAGFNMIEIDDLEIRTTALAWTRQSLTPWMTWRAARRPAVTGDRPGPDA